MSHSKRPPSRHRPLNAVRRTICICCERNLTAETTQSRFKRQKTTRIDETNQTLSTNDYPQSPKTLFSKPIFQPKFTTEKSPRDLKSERCLPTISRVFENQRNKLRETMANWKTLDDSHPKSEKCPNKEQPKSTPPELVDQTSVSREKQTRWRNNKKPTK